MVSRARHAIERLYTGTCDIVEYKPKKRGNTKITAHEEVAVQEGVACRLSYESISSASAAAPTATAAQSIKVFLTPEITVSPGSKLVITQNGVTGEYVRSGMPAVYLTHQEVSLELFEGWV